MSSAELDDLSDEELLAEELALAAADKARPSEHQLAGGAPASFAWLLVVGGAIGVLASIELVLAEMALLRDPASALSCDINPLIGCSDSLLAWQSHLLFGIPNAIVGAVIFGMVLGVGLSLLAGARFARWLWVVMSLAVLGGFAFVAWFLTQSITVFHVLCPWCMVTWAVVIIVGYQVLARAAQGGHLPLPERAARFLYLERWLLTIGTFVLILVAVGIGLWGAWRLLLGI
ncbi:MAG: vitamin K epoxide reductase family protein [Ruaniaceae bacterium]|nr:vitamin K epoxide reductase family protein [Ruaniaceae bacterium]